jgi:hypothetical protein
MPSENYDFVPWDSPDDIHKFFNRDDIEKFGFLAPLAAKIGASKVGQAVATQGVKGALKTGAKNITSKVGTGLKNIKAKVGVKGGGAATEAAGAAEGATSAAKTAAKGASEAVESVAPKPDLGAKMPSTEVTTPEAPAAEPAVETPEPEEASGGVGKKTDYKKVGMQMAQQMQAQSAQKKQAQEQRAMDMARRGASVQTGEPMNIAMRLLKVDDEIPDFSDEPIDQCEMCNKYLHDSDYHVLNDHNYCSDCYNQLAEPEEFDSDFQEKLTGEPMNIAMRLLKEARPHALIPNFDLRHMLNPKSDIQGQLIMQHVPHALSNAESATEVYNQLMQEAKIREEETDYFPLPQTQIEDYGEQHPPIFRYNATNEVTYSPDFQDIHTGEPMEIAFQLLKEMQAYDHDHPVELKSVSSSPNINEACTLCPDPNALISLRYTNPTFTKDYTHHMCYECAKQYDVHDMIHPAALEGTDVKLAGNPMEIAYQLLKDSKVDVSGQHAAKNDPRFWEIMSHYGTQDESKVGEPFLPYSRELAEMTPQVDELLAHYGYKPYYFGGQYGNYSDLGKKNYTTGHLAIFDPHTEAASFGDAQFTDNWRKLHELGHAHGLEDLNHKWGEGRRLGKVGVRTPREMLRAVDWETMALMNQNKLMNEIGLPMTPQEYNRDWNTTVGDAGFRAVTGQFTSPTEEGFVPHDERISPSHAMNAVTRRAEELGLDMDETLRDKRAGARKVASEPMDIAHQLLKTNFNEYFGTKDSWVSLPKEGMDAKPELYGEVADAMNISYEAAGGHSKYKNADDLQEEQKHHRYDMIDNDEDPFVDAAHIYSQREQGFKSSVTAHDGGRESKSALKNHMFENLNRPGHYAETSGAWASVLDREGMPSVTDYDHIRELVNKPISESENGRYMRDIGGKEHEKQIHGTPMREGADWTQDFLQQSLQAHNENKPFFLQDYNFQQGATQ